jgi:hypothetical protein
MLGSLVLETAIGLVFVYLIFSLIASALAEYLSALRDRRAEHLKHLLLNLFQSDDPRGRTMLNLFVAHPMVQALCAAEWKPTFRSSTARLEEGARDLDRLREKWDAAARAASAADAARTAATTAASAAALALTSAANLAVAGGAQGRVSLQTVVDATRHAEASARAARDATAAANLATADIKAKRRANAPPAPAPPAALSGSPDPAAGQDQVQPAQERAQQAREAAPELGPAMARQRAADVADAAAQAARDADQAAARADRANRGLGQELAQGLVVPRYIPDRTFAEALVHVLAAPDTLTALARDAVPPAASAMPNLPLATFWSRFTAALQVVRGIASRLPAESTSSRTKIDAALSGLEDSVKHGGNLVEASVVVGHLETGINELRGAVAAVPDDAVRIELERAVELTLRPLHAVGQDILLLERVSLAISNMADSSIKTALAAALQQAGDDASAVKRSIASWFNEVMDHTSGWYKRNTQRILIVIAIFLCTLNNVDTVALVQHLTTDPQLRVEASEAAVGYLDQDADSPPDTAAATRTEGPDAQKLEAALEQTHLPLWWSRTEWKSLWTRSGVKTGERATFSPSLPRLLAKANGLLLSIMAVSMGAPFWFEVLSRLVNVRLAGPRPTPTVTTALPVGRTAGS